MRSAIDSGVALACTPDDEGNAGFNGVVTGGGAEPEERDAEF